jgi:hypothetical protein
LIYGDFKLVQLLVRGDAAIRPCVAAPFAHAGLPASGSFLSASYNDTSYVFTVNYQPNLVSLNFTAVPEPSTYALLGLGVVFVAWFARRRR